MEEDIFNDLSYHLESIIYYIGVVHVLSSRLLDSCTCAVLIQHTKR